MIATKGVACPSSLTPQPPNGTPRGSPRAKHALRVDSRGAADDKEARKKEATTRKRKHYVEVIEGGWEFFGAVRMGVDAGRAFHTWLALFDTLARAPPISRDIRNCSIPCSLPLLPFFSLCRFALLRAGTLPSAPAGLALIAHTRKVGRIQGQNSVRVQKNYPDCTRTEFWPPICTKNDRNCNQNSANLDYTHC